MERKGTRRQGNAPTINDVARQAGVSPMTVSRVINSGQVRPAMREKVEQAIAELNYSPSAAARRLAGGEERRIALLYSNPSAAYLSEFLVGSLDQASRSGVTLVIERWDETTSVGSVVDHLLRNRIDGVLLPPPLCDLEPMTRALREAGLAAVAVATSRPPEGMGVISIDDYHAAYDMTRHLLTLGHKRIGFIKGNPDQHASARRYEGYLAALADMGVAQNDALVAQGLYTYRSGLDAASRLLELPEIPTAIFASNDDMAAAAVAAAHRQGLDVPRDLTVCGFDDSAIATTIWPELTTIRQPISAMSRRAVDMLVRQLTTRSEAEGVEPASLLLDYELIRRQSDAPPRSGRADPSAGRDDA